MDVLARADGGIEVGARDLEAATEAAGVELEGRRAVARDVLTIHVAARAVKALRAAVAEARGGWKGDLDPVAVVVAGVSPAVRRVGLPARVDRPARVARADRRVLPLLQVLDVAQRALCASPTSDMSDRRGSKAQVATPRKRATPWVSTSRMLVWAATACSKPTPCCIWRQAHQPSELNWKAVAVGCAMHSAWQLQMSSTSSLIPPMSPSSGSYELEATSFQWPPSSPPSWQVWVWQSACR